MTKRIIIKKGREKSILRHHPWLFSGAIDHVEGSPGLGETVEVLSSDGICLGKGAFSPHSQITIRFWTFNPEQDIDPPFISMLLSRAVRAREKSSAPAMPMACRLVNGEGDFFPGLIVDKYGDFLVCQFLTAGAEFWKREIANELQRLLPVIGIYDRSDMEVRLKEGLPMHSGLLTGEEPPAHITIEEGPCKFLVDIKQGHKTGFYLDQKENRRIIREYAEGSEVLNCFAYTGGFGIMALEAGALNNTNVESSAHLLELLSKNIELNGLNPSKNCNLEGNAFHVLRKFRDEGRTFDLVILDPPKFAEGRSHLEKACRGYKDINLLAFKILRPGGVLFTFSCSALVPPELFRKIVSDAALDAGRDAQVLRLLAQAEDHPTGLNFPEGSYLKGLACRSH